MKTDLKRYMCPNVPSNIIYHSQDTEATSVPINRSMGEDVANTHTHTHTHTRTGLLFSHSSTCICNNVDGASIMLS